MSAKTQKTVLVIEDDASLNLMLTDQISEIGYIVHGVSSRAEATALLETVSPDLMLVDMRLPDCDGFDLIEAFSADCPVIVLTAYGSVDQAVRAVHSGASDYLLKPVNFETLELAIKRALDTVELRRDVTYWQSQARRGSDQVIIGKSAEIEKMRNLLTLHAGASSTVLITGASGVGKELAARAIHDLSDRAGGRFVPVDCDAAQEQMIASELFGHEAHAVPGADYRRDGMLEIADGGTIYLSNVDQLPLALQTKILRVMEMGQFRRIGGVQNIPTDIRIIAATDCDLSAAVAEGRFRSELFYLLNAFSVRVPSLVERKADIVDLAQYFLGARQFRRAVEKRLADASYEALMGYDWPGNVRELKNAIERGLIMSGDSPVIEPHHLSMGAGVSPADTSGISLSYDREPNLQQIRDDYIAILLQRFDGNRSKVASTLGISERNLYRIIGKVQSDGVSNHKPRT